MYSNMATQEGDRVVVRRVPLVGPPYLRRGSQLCGRTVGRTCLFILITFGVASAMIGVVLFTSDLQMVTGFWAVGLVLAVIGFLMVFSFIILCCVARSTYNSLPANHPHRAKQFRPDSIPVQASSPPSSYQLLPMRQSISYIPPPGGQSGGGGGGGGGGYPTASSRQTVGYSTLPGRQTVLGYPAAPECRRNIGYPTVSSRQTVGYSTLPGRQTVLGYPATPEGGETFGYSTLREGQTVGYPTTQRGQNVGYLTPFGGPYVRYADSPTRQIVGYQTPPRQYSVCFPIPTIGEADQSSTTLLLPREEGTSPTHSTLMYSENDNPPPYSSLVDDS